MVKGLATVIYRHGPEPCKGVVCECIPTAAVLRPTVTPIQDVGEGIKVATVGDPFGNVIGLIENPHFELPTG